MSLRPADAYLDFSSVTALVVDDHATTRTLIAEVLRGLGITRILKAESATEGWKIVQAGLVDVVFADIELGKEDGLAFVRRIRAAGERRIAGLAIVMVSAHATEARVIEAGAMGADSFISKPFSVARFARAVSEGFANRRMLADDRAAATREI
ncbi:response regulator [Phenylobacterium sp.]|jgi:CheY-like chemotaxis protein|uniref:response regulator n=1 Tax=Phenylobacterium sp. TaxID=1871053 RepID=UPI002F3F483B